FVFLFSQKYPQTSAHIFCYLGRYILRIYLLLHSFVFSCRPTYANRKALELWELSWEEFTRMPSRRSAEEVVQEERDRLLSEAATKGFITNYSGIRTSSNGKRFYIEDTILWNVLDEQNQHYGQAAFFSTWKFIT
ncbi:MEKHLA domain-containing protein, partial [Nostoc sp. CHAB 5834]|nr:MEKHLA domain-containing protein [Nostoc sp. CHAB 5834]